MDGKKASTPSRPASNAPPPISPLRGAGYRPPRPKPTQMPMGWPPYYPNDLIPQTEKVVAEAVKKFPEQTQITELCEFVVSTLTPDVCAAIEAKSLRADLASYRMDNLLDCLLGYNCEDLSKRYQVKKIVVNSDEWKKFVDEIARVHSAAAKDSSSIEEPLGPAPAQPSPTTVANGGNKKDQPADATEAPADNQQTEVDVGETTESGLPKPVLEGKRCAKVIDEVSRIKNFHASGGRTMNEIREEWPNYEVWRIVEQLPQEDQETFERPSMWGPKIGYARLILSKHYGNSTDTINDWVKAYKKHERSKNQKN